MRAHAHSLFRYDKIEDVPFCILAFRLCTGLDLKRCTKVEMSGEFGDQEDVIVKVTFSQLY